MVLYNNIHSSLSAHISTVATLATSDWFAVSVLSDCVLSEIYVFFLIQLSCQSVYFNDNVILLNREEFQLFV